MSILDGIKRISTPMQTMQEAPTKWLDGTDRSPVTKDRNGFPVDLERVLAGDLQYYSANREAVIGERSRLKRERDEEERTRELDELRTLRADQKLKAEAEAELAQAEKQVRKEEHEARVLDIMAAKKAKP